MRRRQRAQACCPWDGKVTFRRYRKAAGRCHRLNGDDGRIYWCVHAGGWHITHTNADEYRRRRVRAA